MYKEHHQKYLTSIRYSSVAIFFIFAKYRIGDNYGWDEENPTYVRLFKYYFLEKQVSTKFRLSWSAKICFNSQVPLWNFLWSFKGIPRNEYLNRLTAEYCITLEVLVLQKLVIITWQYIVICIVQVLNKIDTYCITIPTPPNNHEFVRQGRALEFDYIAYISKLKEKKKQCNQSSRAKTGS